MSVGLSQGQWEALKWVALASMLVDHTGRVLFQGEPWMLDAGRLAFPLFALLLGAGVARQHLGGIKRIGRQLALWGLVAQPFAWLLWRTGAGNILWTMALGVGLVLVARYGEQGFRRWAVCAVLLALGVVVEYGAVGVALVAASEWLCRERSRRSAVMYGGVLAVLCVINGNAYALLVVPLVLVWGRVPVQVPRIRHLFYAVYPVHLAVLFALSILVAY